LIYKDKKYFQEIKQEKGIQKKTYLKRPSKQVGWPLFMHQGFGA